MGNPSDMRNQVVLTAAGQQELLGGFRGCHTDGQKISEKDKWLKVERTG